MTKGIGGGRSDGGGARGVRAALRALALLLALAAAFAAMALGARPAAADPSDGSSGGNQNAGDLSLYHAASSVSGWYKASTNVNNNSDAIHGPGSFKPTDGSKRPEKECPGSGDGSALSGGKADEGCNLDRWWSLALSTPSSAGSFLGFYDVKYSGVALGSSSSSASSEDISYKSLATQSNGGYPGVADYAYFGAALHTMGLDQSGYGAAVDQGRAVSGIVILVLAVLAAAMGAVFQLVLKVLMWINPFYYIEQGLNHAAPADSGLAWEGDSSNGFVRGLQGVLSYFSGIGVYVMLPLFIVSTLVLIVLIANRSDSSSPDQRGRIRTLTRNMAMRWAFIVLIVPLVCGSGYYTMKSVNVASTMTTGTTDLVQSLYVDYGDWAQYNAMGIPKGAVIGYSSENAAAEPLAVYYELNTARLINNSVTRPYSSGLRDGSAPSDNASLTHTTMPYPSTSRNGCNLASMAVGGSAAVSLRADGIVGDLTQSGGNDPGSSRSTSSWDSRDGYRCAASDKVDAGAVYSSTLGLIMGYIKGDKVTAGDYDSYVRGAIQQSMGGEGRKAGSYTPASPFVALNDAGDSSTPMNTPKALGKCTVKPGRNGAGGTSVDCDKDGGRTYVPPQLNGLIQTGSVRPDGSVDNGAGLRAVSFDDDRISGLGGDGPVNAIVNSLGGCGSNGTEVRGKSVTDYAFCTADSAGKRSAEGVSGPHAPTYCSIAPLTGTGADTLTACNMSPLALYNYLNSRFDEKKVTVYSAADTAGTAQTPYHYAVTRVGTGFDGFLNTLYVGSLLGCMAVIGIGLAGSLLVNGLRKSGQTIMATIGSMTGSLSQMGKWVISALTLMVVVLTTMGAYMLSNTAFTYAPALLPACMRLLAMTSNDQLLGYFADNAGVLAMVFKGVISVLLIIFAFWVLRLSDSIVKGLSEGIESLTVKLLGMKGSTRAMQRAVASTDATGLVAKGAGAAGMAVGAGAALAHTDEGERLGDMLADKLKGLTGRDGDGRQTPLHLGSSGDGAQRMQDDGTGRQGQVAPATDAPASDDVQDMRPDDDGRREQDGRPQGDVREAGLRTDGDAGRERPERVSSDGYLSPADRVQPSQEALRSGNDDEVMLSADADAVRQAVGGEADAQRPASQELGSDADLPQGAVRQADEESMRGQGQAQAAVWTPGSQALGSGSASDRAQDAQALGQANDSLRSQAKAMADVSTPGSAGLSSSADETTRSVQTPSDRLDATVGDQRTVMPQDELNVTDASSTDAAPGSGAQGAGAADGRADAGTPGSERLASGQASDQAALDDDGTVTVSDDALAAPEDASQGPGAPAPAVSAGQGDAASAGLAAGTFAAGARLAATPATTGAAGAAAAPAAPAYGPQVVPMEAVAPAAATMPAPGRAAPSLGSSSTASWAPAAPAAPVAPAVQAVPAPAVQPVQPVPFVQPARPARPIRTIQPSAPAVPAAQPSSPAAPAAGAGTAGASPSGPGVGATNGEEGSVNA